MAKETSGNERAFPNAMTNEKGLTKREYIAVHAMQALIIQSAAAGITTDSAACQAVDYANALIKELEKIPA